MSVLEIWNKQTGIQEKKGNPPRAITQEKKGNPPRAVKVPCLSTSESSVAEAENSLQVEIHENEDQKSDVEPQVKVLKEEITNMDTMVKQHAKLAEEAFSGWEQAAIEVRALMIHLEAVTLEKFTAENRAFLLDGALKECTKQLEILKEEIRIEQQCQRKTARLLATEEEIKMALIMSSNQPFVSRNKSENKLQSMQENKNQQKSPSKNTELRHYELMVDFLEVERQVELMEDFLKMERHLELMDDILERERLRLACLSTKSIAHKGKTPMKCNIPKVPRPLSSSKRPKQQPRTPSASSLLGEK